MIISWNDIKSITSSNNKYEVCKASKTEGKKWNFSKFIKDMSFQRLPPDLRIRRLPEKKNQKKPKLKEQHIQVFQGYSLK